MSRILGVPNPDVNDDDITWLDARYSRGYGDRHLLNVGINHHLETMRSESQALRELQLDDPTITGDSFDYRMQGAYMQTELYFDQIEMSLAARFDQIEVDYIEQGDGDELSETLILPPALLKYAHSEAWTSRFSAGRGYRAPLSFFESDHGLLDAGYDVAIDSLERSLSFGYSVSYARNETAATLSAYTTTIDELAFIDFDARRPRLVNAEESARVDTFDIEFSHALNEHWTIGGGGELFRYDRAYRSSFGIAPIEERTRLFLDYAGHGWSAYTQLTWVGGRDLSRYGTGERYNILNPDGSLDAPKQTRVPSWWTLDMRVERELSEHWTAYVGGTNLTGYNQAEDDESPLMFDGDGGYDVVHIWGPLRGRVLYAGVTVRL